MRVSPNGGEPEVIAAPGADETAASPEMLPGGRAILFSVKKLGDSWDKGQVVVQSLGGARKTLVNGGADARYLTTGHLIYALSGTLLAVAFDPDKLSVSGGSVPLIEGVRRAVATPPSAVAQISFSTTGSLVYVPGPVTLASDDSGTDLALFDRKGANQPLKLPLAPYAAPRVSPDGKWVAFERADEKETSVWTYELVGGHAAQRLTFAGNNRAPVWSPDGQWMAFQSDTEKDLAIFRKRADGSGNAERLTKPDTGVAHTPQSWSPDGAHLLYSDQKGEQSTLWTLALKDRQTAAYGDMQSREAVFSPDGRWILYQTMYPASGTVASADVYIDRFPRAGEKRLVKQGGGHPFWSPKGDEIIMNTSGSGGGRSTVVGVTLTPRVSFGPPADFARAGRVEGSPSTTRRNVDMMPGGQHVIGVMSKGGLEAQQVGAVGTPEMITVVINWFDEVRQRVPVGK